MNYQYPRRAVSPRETDRIDSSRTVFLSRGPNRISHETKDLLTVKSLSGWRTRTAGRGHGRRVKKEIAGREGRHRVERVREALETRDESTEELRESPDLLDSEVSGGRSPACCQLVSLSAHARWHRGDQSRVWIHRPLPPHTRGAPCRTRIVIPRACYSVCV